MHPAVAREREAFLAAHADAPWDAEVTPALFLPGLVARLVPMLARTLALELNVARLRVMFWSRGVLRS